MVVQVLANRGFFRRYPWANAPTQTALVGFVLIFATPLGCAFFSQMASIKVSLRVKKSDILEIEDRHSNFFKLQVNDLEPEVKEIVRKKNPDLEVAWYNKGL